MKPRVQNPSRWQRTRRGSILTAELLLILPIVALLLAGMLELGTMLHGKQKLAAACREGARAASIAGDPAEVNRVVQLALGLDASAGLTVEVTAENGSELARPGEMVLVTVGLPVNQISFFAPNFFGLGSQMVYSQAAMRRE
jgi:TadE-like protein